jgi:hypothetical protein
MLNFIRAITLSEQEYRIFLGSLSKVELEIFLKDFESEIWSLRYKITEYNEKAKTRKGVEYWKMRSKYATSFLMSMLRRRRIASILFAELKPL